MFYENVNSKFLNFDYNINNKLNKGNNESRSN